MRPFWPRMLQRTGSLRLGSHAVELRLCNPAVSRILWSSRWHGCLVINHKHSCSHKRKIGDGCIVFSIVSQAGRHLPTSTLECLALVVGRRFGFVASLPGTPGTTQFYRVVHKALSL